MWLMVFDSPFEPAPGSPAVVVVRFDPGRQVQCVAPGMRFTRGVAWGWSEDPGAYVPSSESGLDVTVATAGGGPECKDPSHAAYGKPVSECAERECIVRAVMES